MAVAPQDIIAYRMDSDLYAQVRKVLGDLYSHNPLSDDFLQHLTGSLGDVLARIEAGAVLDLDGEDGPDMRYIEVEQFNKLRPVLERLSAAPKPTGDQRRDLANIMFAVVDKII